MFDKLAAIERQYESLMERLGSAELQSDPSEYRKQAKQLSEIELLVERFREYKSVVRDVAADRGAGGVGRRRHARAGAGRAEGADRAP